MKRKASVAPKKWVYVPDKYLEPGDPGSYDDYPVKDKPSGSSLGLFDEAKLHVCPKCEGHGGWNLKLNAYSLPPGVEDSPEARHRYSHFKSMCGACWGWGWSSDDCAHEWTGRGRNLGNCLNEWVCGKCGATRVVDSSD